MLKADLHIHTKYSMDCDTPLEKIVARCNKLGINCIAIADHGTIEGALRMQEIAPFPVIIAEEVLTPVGEIMGVFLKEGISSGSSVRETIERIKEQDALVCLPHPFDTLRRLRLSELELDALAADIDIVEVFNSRSPLQLPALKAQAFADKHGLAKCAGSDAHSTLEIGRAYVEMPEFKDKDSYLQALRAGTITGRKSSLFIHFLSVWARIKKAF
ncbi:MAG TPA: PHP domain-containing protein [Dehalococcoidia bacterium]|nr:PHP domain-containing protein [Dehalococcoidia bacterium]